MQITVKDFISVFMSRDESEKADYFKENFNIHLSVARGVKNRWRREHCLIYKVNRDTGLLLVFDNCNHDHGDTLNMDEVLDLSNRVFVYDLCGHSGDWFIEEVESLDKAKEHIESPHGLINMFTTAIHVMCNGKFVDYNFNREKVCVEWK